ncbi:hypothetical protein KAZ66_00975 [Candidatus Woesebacteria bacterium]|nr:hypothetical protein [Candidatus Woesebacteria bacterium]
MPISDKAKDLAVKIRIAIARQEVKEDSKCGEIIRDEGAVKKANIIGMILIAAVGMVRALELAKAAAGENPENPGKGILAIQKELGIGIEDYRSLLHYHRLSCADVVAYQVNSGDLGSFEISTL